MAALACLSLWAAPAPIMAPWDVFILLDGGYRIMAGQAPGTDFANPIGPLTYGLVSLGMRLESVPSLAAVSYGGVIFLPVVAVLAWRVSRVRLPAGYAAAFTVFLAVVVVAVRPLGYSPRTTTYAMLYNRYGWALYGILLLLVLLRPRRPGPPRAVIGAGLTLGVLLGLLFYCKISFLVAGLVAATLGWALGTLPRRPSLWLAAAAGFGAVATAMRLLFGVRVTHYLADLDSAAGAQDARQRMALLAHTIIDTTPVWLTTLVVLGSLYVAARGCAARPDPRLPVAVLYILGSCVLIAAGDAPERGQLPALVVAGLLLVAHLKYTLPRWAGGPRRPVLARRRPTQLPTLLPVLLAVLLAAATGPIVGRDALALGKSMALRGYVAQPPAGQRLDGERLRDFVIPANSRWATAYRTANEVPAMINDGLAVLRRHVAAGDTVFTVALTDPFSFALSLPPNRGGPLWWDLGFDFDRTTHPDAEQLLGHTEWVMVPLMTPGQGCCQETVRVMLDLYGPYLAAHFTEAERTSNWILLSRTSSG
ncbi:MAG TPA: hypothetical protein VGJ95_00225 [Pseudonocardiaceae bacterium]